MVHFFIDYLCILQMTLVPGQHQLVWTMYWNAKMEPVAMDLPWAGRVVMLMEEEQNALPIIQQCVLNLFVLLEERITAASPRQYVAITEESDHVTNQVGLNISIP